jgi:intracellular sulfur oxidation DsrE/DsrF family protein
MDRRNIFKTAFATAAGLFAARSGTTGARADANTQKVVYHLSDAEKVAFVLSNVRNHIDGMGGPQNIRIAIVVHGPALKSFLADTTNANVKTRVNSVINGGVVLHACANTMVAQALTLNDLLPGFVIAEKGGVVRLAELQQDGYVYLRP